MRRLLLVVLPLLAGLFFAQTAATARESLLYATVGPGPILSLDTGQEKTVTRVKAGRYYIVVRDRSVIRNFHLRGPGIDRRTPVKKVHAYEWHLRLRKGVYTYLSDPQSRTKKRFRVV